MTDILIVQVRRLDVTYAANILHCDLKCGGESPLLIPSPPLPSHPVPPCTRSMPEQVPLRKVSCKLLVGFLCSVKWEDNWP